MGIDCTNMPRIWGAGQLLAFSGLDGFTNWAEPFVLHTGREPGSLRTRLPVEAEIQFEGLREPEFRLLLGDALVADCANGPFRAGFVDHHTVVGEMPAGTEMLADGERVGKDPICIAGNQEVALTAVASHTRWVLHVHATGEGTAGETQCLEALSVDMDAVLAARAAFVGNLAVPSGLAPSEARLFRKAASVIKVNVEAPCGVIGRRWTTPDRWPHRNMWLWDSAFHSLGLA